MPVRSRLHSIYADRHRQAELVVHANEPDNDGVWADDDAEPHLLGHEFGLDVLDAAIDEARGAAACPLHRRRRARQADRLTSGAWTWAQVRRRIEMPYGVTTPGVY